MLSNRLFRAGLQLATGLLAGLLLLFLAAMAREFISSPSLRPLDPKEIAFAVRLSLLTATCAATLAILLAIPIAYYLTRFNHRGRHLIDTLLDLPLVLSPIALGAMILIFFHTGLGQLVAAGLGGVVFNVRGIVIAQFFVIIGLGIRQVKLAFEGVDPELENIARTLGCSQFQTFRRVALPLARRGLWSALLLVWARAIGEFGATLTLAGATPMKTETIPTAIYLSFATADLRGAIALIFILLLLSLSVLYATRKLNR
ncbi:MAG: ABC transporter permease subunit [Deltaproteobacteria bacterium]|nr:ABC transporter permease subunit [Deltaproteobacteria bacterium]